MGLPVNKYGMILWNLHISDEPSLVSTNLPTYLHQTSWRESIIRGYTDTMAAFLLWSVVFIGITIAFYLKHFYRKRSVTLIYYYHMLRSEPIVCCQAVWYNSPLNTSSARTTHFPIRARACDNIDCQVNAIAVSLLLSNRSSKHCRLRYYRFWMRYIKISPQFSIFHLNFRIARMRHHKLSRTVTIFMSRHVWVMSIKTEIPKPTHVTLGILHSISNRSS